MVIFNVEDEYTTVTGEDARRAGAILKDVLAARPEGYAYMPAYKQGTWDGYIRMYQRKDNRFPTGLLGIAVDALTAKGFKCKKRDKRDIPVLHDYQVRGFVLRDYQEEAIQTALEATRGVLKMATNAGKTLIAAGSIQATGNRAVVVVPSRVLLQQTSNDLSEMLDVEVGRVGDEEFNPRDVTVITMASLPKLIQEWRGILDNITLIIDECHHTRADTIFDHAFMIPGPFRYGMSGTPLRQDKLSDLKLMAATGRVICEVTNDELIEQGYSTPPIIYFHTVEAPHVKVSYQMSYGELIVRNNKRNRMIADMAESEVERGPVLILVNWIEHARLIFAEALRGRSWHEADWAVLTGKDSKRHIKGMLNDFSKGGILVATDVFGEGIDIPEIATLIMAAGGKSPIKLLQRIGRGLRVAEGKDAVHVHDFLDDTDRYLLRHSEERYDTYKQEGFRVELPAAV